jgi:endonuclease/exonuclease/phosphatase family metal-dependent hydrolase
VESNVYDAFQQGLAMAGYAGTHALKRGNRPDGCATFFRRDCFTLLNKRRIAYADGAGGADSGNIAQLLLLEYAGKRLEIANTHLKWDPPDTPRERQLGYRQVQEAIEALRPEASSPDGHIICGDFNVTPQSYVIEALLAAGFDYAHRDCAGVNTCNSNGQAKLIDYVFYRGSLRARPILPAVIDEQTALPSEEQPSDHLPLLVEFDWNS